MSARGQLANDPLTSAWAAGFRTALRQYARAELPEAMVPARFVVLPELPKLPNGKVDRNNLPDEVATDAADAAFVAPRTTVEVQLARIWQDLLGLPKVGVETSFFELGGDSLSVLQMSAQVRDVYDVRLDLHRLFEDPTIAQLARMVSSTADHSITGAANPRGVSEDAMRADAVLPDDVGPQPGARPPVPGPDVTHLLLTGGTGYTGAFLLREFLDRSPATVSVLVRATDHAQAAERAVANLTEFGLLRDGDRDRIVGVPGDTARPYLGMSRADYRRVAAQAQLIVHNAAISSWIVPYDKIKPTNVFGALEVLRLAGTEQVKAVHFVSTVGIYPGHRGERVWPEERLTDAEEVVGGYRQSKWVADNLMLNARERGIPTHVYRLGAIAGSQVSGACSPDTFINHLIKGCIQLGGYLDYDLVLDLVPVDYCAAAIAHIALSRGVDGEVGAGAGGDRWAHAIFNVPSFAATHMNDIFELIVAQGYPLRRLAYDDWYRELTQAVERGEENELSVYLPLFGRHQPAEEVGYPGSRPVFGIEHLQAALAGSGIECHPVDRELFARYLGYFVDTGFLPPPPESNPSADPTGATA